MMTGEHVAYLSTKHDQAVTELRRTQNGLQAAKETLHKKQDKLQTAQRLIEELEKKKTPPAAFVKANVKKLEEGKKRDIFANGDAFAFPSAPNLFDNPAWSTSVKGGTSGVVPSGESARPANGGRPQTPDTIKSIYPGGRNGMARKW